MPFTPEQIVYSTKVGTLTRTQTVVSTLNAASDGHGGLIGDLNFIPSFSESGGPLSGTATLKFAPVKKPVAFCTFMALGDYTVHYKVSGASNAQVSNFGEPLPNALFPSQGWYPFGSKVPVRVVGAVTLTQWDDSADGFAWVCGSTYAQYRGCPYAGSIPLIGGHEHYVFADTQVCTGDYNSANYGDLPASMDADYSFHHWDYTQSDYNNSENRYQFFPALDGGNSAGEFTSWVEGALPPGGSGTRQVTCTLPYGLGSGHVAGTPQPYFGVTNVPNPGTLGQPFLATITETRTWTLNNAQLVVFIFTQDSTGGGPNGWVGPHCVVDEWKGNVALLSTGPVNTGVTPNTMPLLVAVNRSVQKNIGSGSGSSGGWEIYKLQDVDARSDWGLTITPSGRLVVYFDNIDSSGNPTAQYRYSDDWATGSGAMWSAAAAATPNRSQVLSTGRMQQQTWRVEVSGS